MDFYARVKMVCDEIPPGSVATYGQIALLCGKPRNARQVGMALNRRVAGVPAHRVVDRQGRLSGAGAFPKPDTQKNLLEAEGVEIGEGQQVNLKSFGWNHTLADALSFLRRFEESGI